LGLIFLAIAVGAGVLAGLGWWIGPPVLSWLSGSQTSISGSLIAVLVASSALVAALSVSGSAVLAASRHFVYSAGWVASAVVTIGVMVTPLDFVPKVESTLLLGPIAGLLIHLSYLLASRTSRAADR